MTRTWMIGALALLALAAGCGDDDDADGDDVDATTTTTEAAEEPEEPEEGDLLVAMCDEWDTFVSTGDVASVQTILDNAADIELSEQAVEALTFLAENPDATEPEDQEQHEAGLSIADEEFAAVCPVERASWTTPKRRPTRALRRGGAVPSN